MKREAMIAHLVLHGWECYRYPDGLYHLWHQGFRHGLSYTGRIYDFEPLVSVYATWDGVTDGQLSAWVNRLAELAKVIGYWREHP